MMTTIMMVVVMASIIPPPPATPANSKNISNKSTLKDMVVATVSLKEYRKTIVVTIVLSAALLLMALHE